jgi:hypothetical protein
VWNGLVPDGRRLDACVLRDRNRRDGWTAPAVVSPPILDRMAAASDAELKSGAFSNG